MHDRPTVRENSVDLERQSAPTSNKEGSLEMTAKVVRVTDNGEMVIKITPELQQRLASQFHTSSTTLVSPPDNTPSASRKGSTT